MQPFFIIIIIDVTSRPATVISSEKRIYNLLVKSCCDRGEKTKHKLINELVDFERIILLRVRLQKLFMKHYSRINRGL